MFPYGNIGKKQIKINCLAGRLISKKGRKWPAGSCFGNLTVRISKKIRIREIKVSFLNNILKFSFLLSFFD